MLEHLMPNESPCERLIQLVESWAGPLRWEATWKLSAERKRCLEAGRQQQRVAWCERKYFERRDELVEINRLVRTHAPELLGKVPDMPFESARDFPAAERLGQQTKELLGLLLVRKNGTGSTASITPTRRRRHRKAPNGAATPEYASVEMLANLVKKTKNAVDAKLRRYRKINRGCYIENDLRQKGEPKYLYRVADALPVLKSDGRCDGR
jgi:hypothetical protein